MSEEMHDREEAPEDRASTKSVDTDKIAGKSLDPLLLEMLVCPSTKKPLVFDRDKQELISLSAALAYPVRDGVPIMLIDEARALTDEEVAKAKAGATV